MWTNKNSIHVSLIRILFILLMVDLPGKVSSGVSLSVPRNLVVRQFKEKSIHLTWSVPLYAANGSTKTYSIQMRDTESSAWVAVDSTSCIEYTVEGLSPDCFYRFRVSSENTNQHLESAFVKPARATGNSCAAY